MHRALEPGVKVARRCHVSPLSALDNKDGEKSSVYLDGNYSDGKVGRTTSSSQTPRPAYKAGFLLIWVISGWGCFTALSDMEHELPRVSPILVSSTYVCINKIIYIHTYRTHAAGSTPDIIHIFT